MQAIALVLKWKFPLRRPQVEMLAEALVGVRQGLPAKDPISGKYFQPLEASSKEQEKVFWLLDHFPLRRLQRSFAVRGSTPSDDLTHCARSLVKANRFQLLIAWLFLFASIAASIYALQYLTHAKLAWLPTL